MRRPCRKVRINEMLMTCCIIIEGKAYASIIKLAGRAAIMVVISERHTLHPALNPRPF